MRFFHLEKFCTAVVFTAIFLGMFFFSAGLWADSSWNASFMRVYEIKPRGSCKLQRKIYVQCDFISGHAYCLKAGSTCSKDSCRICQDRNCQYVQQDFHKSDMLQKARARIKDSLQEAGCTEYTFKINLTGIHEYEEVRLLTKEEARQSNQEYLEKQNQMEECGFSMGRPNTEGDARKRANRADQELQKATDCMK